MSRPNVILLILFVVFGCASQAIAGNPFTVSDVKIEAYDRDVSKAREQAIRVGTLDAAYKLFDRLTLPSDRLALDPPLVITGELAEQWVEGIEISNEKRSSSRYLGTLSVTFDKPVIRAFLRGRSLPFVESQALPVLVVALWQNEEGQTVLSSDNPLARVFKRPEFQNHLVPLKLAKMNEEDADLNELVWKLATLNPETLHALAGQYNVREVIIASASEPGPGVINLRAKKIAMNDDGTEFVEDLGAFEGAAESTTQSRAVRARALYRAISYLTQSLDARWKQTAMVRNTDRKSVRLTALYDSLTQWQHLRDALGGVALVEEARLDALSVDGALLTLTYMGSEAQLARRLAQKGVILRSEDLGLVARLR
jgi:Uncharacterized protein conserved in bacteria (DUF2066)